jgi:hypothetical protein
MNELAVTSASAVMFSSTDVASAGTVEASERSSDEPGVSGPEAPSGIRVSRTRVGVTPTMPPGGDDGV